jgi:hypothetical protein
MRSTGICAHRSQPRARIPGRTPRGSRPTCATGLRLEFDSRVRGRVQAGLGHISWRRARSSTRSPTRSWPIFSSMTLAASRGSVSTLRRRRALKSIRCAATRTTRARTTFQPAAEQSGFVTMVSATTTAPSHVSTPSGVRRVSVTARTGGIPRQTTLLSIRPLVNAPSAGRQLDPRGLRCPPTRPATDQSRSRTSG